MKTTVFTCLWVFGWPVMSIPTGLDDHHKQHTPTLSCHRNPLILSFTLHIHWLIAGFMQALLMFFGLPFWLHAPLLCRQVLSRQPLAKHALIHLYFPPLNPHEILSPMALSRAIQSLPQPRPSPQCAGHLDFEHFHTA